MDQAVCGDGDLLDGLGTARLTAELRSRVYAADPGALTRRARHAESERHVRLRPAPDTMTYLTALLPVAQGVAAYTALGRDTDTLRATGAGNRTRGQVMADLLLQRLTGQSSTAAVPISVDLIVSDATLLGSGVEPAVVPGYGPVPAQVAREMVTTSLDSGEHAAGVPTLPTWLRRVYTNPSGQLVALSTRRRFTADGLADLLRIRDQGLCRTPWCDAPARHGDHVITAAHDGPTAAVNTQQLCEACNYAKQALGWTAHTARSPPYRGDHHPDRSPLPVPSPSTTHTSTQQHLHPHTGRCRGNPTHRAPRGMNLRPTHDARAPWCSSRRPSPIPGILPARTSPPTHRITSTADPAHIASTIFGLVHAGVLVTAAHAPPAHPS